MNVKGISAIQPKYQSPYVRGDTSTYRAWYSSESVAGARYTARKGTPTNPGQARRAQGIGGGGEINGDLAPNDGSTEFVGPVRI